MTHHCQLGISQEIPSVAIGKPSTTDLFDIDPTIMISYQWYWIELSDSVLAPQADNAKELYFECPMRN